MPTYDQLDDEAAWRAEFAAPAIARLAGGLQAHWPDAEIGIRGDNNHMSGYHRSRRWIKESRFCTNRSYSVSRTSGDKSGGDSNWACALDFGGIPQSELHEVCKRLDSAVRAGRLEKVTEWYGNFGGDDRVDGWDNISDRIASSDSSHLTHLHLGFDRGRANEDHSDLLAILIGDDMPNALEYSAAWLAQRIAEMAPLNIPASTEVGYSGYNAPNRLAEAINKLLAAAAADETRDAATLATIQALAAGGTNIDTAAIIDKIKAEANATRDLVEQRHAAEMAELARLHATQLAEKEAELAGLRAELEHLGAEPQG